MDDPRNIGNDRRKGKMQKMIERNTELLKLFSETKLEKIKEKEASDNAMKLKGYKKKTTLHLRFSIILLILTIICNVLFFF